MMEKRDEALSFEGIRKAYGSQEVIRDFSGAFASRRLGALVGPNGAGKTTLLRIAAGLQSADAGLVQGRQVIYYGGFDVLPVGGTINRLRRALGLGDVPNGARPLASLSRGQLHAVGLAATMDLRRHTILLDEPWTALEPDAREDLNRRLTELRDGGHVIVCSSHDLDEVARIADDVVVLRDGRAAWRRREDMPSARFDREELMRLYRVDQ